jgi:hypothetical protein
VGYGEGVPSRNRIGRTVAIPIALLALLLLATGARGATVTVGSPFSQVLAPEAFNAVGTVTNSALPEQGALVTSPISGTVIRWRITGASGGPFKLRVLRPAGGLSYTGAGTSAGQTPTGSGTQTFTTSLPIQAGDAIGLDNSNESDMIGVAETPGAQYIFWEPPLPDGTTEAGTNGFGPIEVGFNADVQPLPTVSSIKPSTGSFKGKTKVTVTGTDFTGATAVAFGTVPATSFTVDSDSQVTAVAPAVKKPVKVDIGVTTLAGSTAPGPSDLFTYKACKVPKLKGKKLSKAKKRLRKAHCKPGKVKLTKGVSKAKGKVVKQKPAPGKLKAPGAKVKLTLG